MGGTPNFKEITLLMLNKVHEQHINNTYILKMKVEKEESNVRTPLDETLEQWIEYFQDACLYIMKKPGP